jgi:hypothetical protein
VGVAAVNHANRRHCIHTDEAMAQSVSRTADKTLGASNDSKYEFE